MQRSICAFLIYLLIIVSYVYAMNEQTQQHTIIKTILHNNDTIPSIPIHNKKHMIFILELIVKTQGITPPNQDIMPLTIQNNIEINPINATKIQENTPYKYIVLKDFIVKKQQNINTPIGMLILQQHDNLKHAYIQIPNDMPIQSAALSLQNGQFYLILFDNIYNITTTNQNSFIRDSKTSNMLQESTYEISSWRYFLVLGIMIVILIVLYIIKIRQHRGIETSNIVLEQAKILDSKNKVALIRYGDKRYLIGLNPHGITLLDTLSTCDTQADTTTKNQPPHKETKQQNFMQLLLKR